MAQNAGVKVPDKVGGIHMWKATVVALVLAVRATAPPCALLLLAVRPCGPLFVLIPPNPLPHIRTPSATVLAQHVHQGGDPRQGATLRRVLCLQHLERAAASANTRAGHLAGDDG